jgi:hypothetical protein
MGDFDSEQGLSDFETSGIAGYCEDFKRAKTPRWAKRCRLWMGTNSLQLTISAKNTFWYSLKISPLKHSLISFLAISDTTKAGLLPDRNA